MGTKAFGPNITYIIDKQILPEKARLFYKFIDFFFSDSLFCKEIVFFTEIDKLLFQKKCKNILNLFSRFKIAKKRFAKGEKNPYNKIINAIEEGLLQRKR